jgi:long-subunit acyl-CoA synthetase (AMP-forming)
MMKLSLCPIHKAEDTEWRFCGIWARNRAEWCTTLLAGMHFNITNIGFYDAMSAPAVDYIINQTELVTIFCEGGLVKKIIDMKKKGMATTLKNLVLYDDIDKELAAEAIAQGLSLVPYNNVLSEGQRSENAYVFRES